jgi:hypothetical protein
MIYNFLNKEALLRNYVGPFSTIVLCFWSKLVDG